MNRQQLRERIRTEGPISLPDAAREVGVSQASVLRWIVAGRAGVKLEAARLRGQWFTSRPRLAEFASKT